MMLDEIFFVFSPCCFVALRNIFFVYQHQGDDPEEAVHYKFNMAMAFNVSSGYPGDRTGHKCANSGIRVERRV
jgi:hypothetical protein